MLCNDKSFNLPRHETWITENLSVQQVCRLFQPVGCCLRYSNSAIPICTITFISGDYLKRKNNSFYQERKLKCFQVPTCHLGNCVLLSDKNRNVLRRHSRKKVYLLLLDIGGKVIKNNYKLQLCSPGALATSYAEPFLPDDPFSIPDNKLHNFCLVKQKK